MDSLPIMESFYTLQGEGYHQGKAAYFVRLAGCDVGCHWCDVKESWNADNHPKLTYSEILDLIADSNAKIVVVTGGEPLMYDLSFFTQVLKDSGYFTHLETSGAYEPTGKWDWFCLSPKKFKKPRPEAYKQADELKIIVYNRSDFDFALEEASKVSDNCLLYLQPEWGKMDSMGIEIVEFIKSNPKWRLCLQTHKYLNIP